MARVSAINFQNLNKGLLNDGPAKETWAKLTINKKLTKVLDCLEEAETCVVAAKECIVSSKDAIESVKTFIGMAQVDIRTAEECIVEFERRIKHLKSEMDSKYKYVFSQNSKFLSNTYSGREERLECSSRSKTLDRSILDHKLDTIGKCSTESDLNLENYENIKYKVYEDGDEISVIPKETTQSSLKAKSSLYGSMDSLDECNPVNKDCELDSPNKSSNYLNVGPFKVSKDYFKESRDNFCSEIYREDNHYPQPTNIFTSNRGLGISSKNVGKLYICDEEDIQNEKSFQIFNNSRILGKQCQSLYNCNPVATPTREISKLDGKLIRESDIRGLEKIPSSSTDGSLIPNLAYFGENDSLKTKDFVMSSAQFLLENQEKLRNLLTCKQCCSEKSQDARYVELYSVTSNDSEDEICVLSTSDNSNDLDKVSNTLGESRLSSSANTLKNNDASENGQSIEISNKPASSKKPDPASIDEKSNNCSKSFTPDKRDSLEIKNTNHRSSDSDDPDSSDASLSNDCSFVAISVASLDTPPQSDISNISRDEETTDTSVHDNSAEFLTENYDNSDYLSENYEPSMYTSDTSSDSSSDSYETESTSDSDMSLTDCSEEENCSRSYQIYTDSSMNDDLTKSLLNDFANASINLDNSLSKNDNLTYLSFKEGVSSASLNNSDASSQTKTSKLHEESFQDTEFETSKAKLNIPARSSKSSSPAKMSDESQKCEVDFTQTLIVAPTQNITSKNSSDNNEEMDKIEFKYPVVESNSDSKIRDVAVDVVDSKLD